MRKFLAKRIPALVRVTSVSEEVIASSVKASVAHSFLVSLDATVGVFGGHIPFITISSRTALALLKAQQVGDVSKAPLWALLLGAALETPWAIPFISYHGHLQGAMEGDFARTQFVMRFISGA